MGMKQPDLVVGIDFECFYDTDYTLKKLSTSEYVRHDHFNVISCAIRTNRQRKAKVYFGFTAIQKALAQYDWANAGILAHNTAFDGLILSHHFNVVPVYYYDTMSMARALVSHAIGAGLDEVAHFLGFKGKHDGGRILQRVKGKRLADLTRSERTELGQYNAQDVDMMWDIFRYWKDFPQDELDLIHLTINAFANPVLDVDKEAVEVELNRARRERHRLFGKVAPYLDLDAAKTKIQKNKQKRDEYNSLTATGKRYYAIQTALRTKDDFAHALKENGAKVPYKVSPTTKKRTYAFAKNDLDFIALGSHAEEAVRHLYEAKLEASSSINITRAERLLQRVSRPGWKLPIGLNYCKAHTFRWTGGDKLNPQNFPARGRNGAGLRRSIIAPKGYKIVVVDSSQIEARMNAWFWNHTELLKVFAESDQGLTKDPYCHQADKIYGREITKANDEERFVGKVCLGGETQVLTRTGWKRIVDITLNDQLWDGIEWVKHAGVLHVGEKETQTKHGLSATADHKILTEDGWKEWQEVHTNPTLFQSALHLGNLRWYATSSIHLKPEKCGDGTPFVDVPVELNHKSTLITLKQDVQRAVINALNVQHRLNAIGSIKRQWQTMSTELACLIDYLPLSAGAITRKIRVTNTTDLEELLSTNHGKKTEPLFFDMYKLLKDGITQSWKWIEKITKKDIPPVTSNSLLEEKTQVISVNSKMWKQKIDVYDVLSCGPRNRFTVLTDKGPIIVHNCILGLGYGMGAAKFQYTLESGAMGPSVILSLRKAQEAVAIYRGTNQPIIQGWRKLEDHLAQMISGNVTEHKCVTFDGEEVHMPNGLSLHYPDLTADYHEATNTYRNFTYMNRGDAGSYETNLYGGKFNENVIQSLSRIVVGQQMLRIAERYRVVSMSHDEVVSIAPTKQADQALEWQTEQMRWVPDWCTGVPLNAEGKIAKYYSK